jgi:hypothetical protein
LQRTSLSSHFGQQLVLNERERKVLALQLMSYGFDEQPLTFDQACSNGFVIYGLPVWLWQVVVTWA